MVKPCLISTEHHAQRGEVGEEDEAEAGEADKDKAEAVDGAGKRAMSATRQ